ncbi:MAG TPA: hypothetical protein VKA54_22385 [Gemmatimonadaceae bacterium]|nr:hypothetical protein [Gemmatimonadaceae bacterium]
MALRSFSDLTGSVWNVWNVQAPAFERSVQEPLREGWLCFQRPEGGDRYRLPMSDAPPAWEQLPAERLDLLRRMAVMSPPTGPMRRVPSPERATEDEARDRVSGERPVIGADDREG